MTYNPENGDNPGNGELTFGSNPININAITSVDLNGVVTEKYIITPSPVTEKTIEVEGKTITKESISQDANLERQFAGTDDIAQRIYYLNRNKYKRSFDENVLQKISDGKYGEAISELQNLANYTGKNKEKNLDKAMAKKLLDSVKGPNEEINDLAMQAILTYTYGAKGVKNID